MARSLRINQIDGYYHITSRGNARQDIFFIDEDRRRFVSQLRDNLATYQIKLYAGVLMTNHFHLLIRLSRANLSTFMQRLLTSYAMYVHYKHGRPGHLFQGRFKAKIVEDESYLIRLTRYIHLNPIKTKAGRDLNDTDKLQYLEQYQWSTYPAYIGKSAPPGYLTLDLLKYFGDQSVKAQREYKKYISECIVQDDEELKQVLSSSIYAVGSDQFIKNVELGLTELRHEDCRDQDVNYPHAYISLERINRCVCDFYQVELDILKRRSRNAGRAKRAAIELACRFSGLSQREIGQHYGGIRCQSVSKIRRQIRELNGSEDEVKEFLKIMKTLQVSGQKAN